MLTFDKVNNNKEKNKPLINLYKQSDFNFDYKLDPDIKKEDKILYYDTINDLNIENSDESDDENQFLLIDDLNIDKTQYLPYPYIEDKPFLKLLITGASGVGKSTLMANILKMMVNKLNGNLFVLYYTPNNIDLPIQKYFKKIFNGNCLMITPDLIKKTLEYNLKGNNQTKKIKLMFTLDDIHQLQKQKNCPVVCVYDDVEGTVNNDIKQLYLKSMKEVLVMGRARDHKNQSNISTIIINHKPLQGSATTDAFNEANYIAIHLKSISTTHIVEILKNKIGYDDTTIKQILKLKKRNAGMCIFSKSYPYHVMIHGDNPAILLQL